MRFGEVEICRPRDERDRSLPKTVRLRLVEVREGLVFCTVVSHQVV